MQGCAGQLLKMLIGAQTKMFKKTGTLAMALQFQDAVALAARPAKLEFLLGLS